MRVADTSFYSCNSAEVNSAGGWEPLLCVTSRRFTGERRNQVLSPGAVRTLRGAADQECQQLPIYIPPGKQLYRDYCAACHGSNGKGHGPVARSLREPPADLTTLAERHGGTFPEEYVTNVLRFGVGFSAHGSSEMPVWGPIFEYQEHYSEAAVRQRIKKLCEYLESIQGS